MNTPVRPSAGSAPHRLLLGFMIGLCTVFLGASTSRADIEINTNFSIGGFIAYDYNVKDDLADNPPLSNPNERNFDLTSEVDLKIKWEWATARFDLNLPSDGNEEQGIAPADPNGFGLEQARFDLMPTFGRAV